MITKKEELTLQLEAQGHHTVRQDDDERSLQRVRLCHEWHCHPEAQAIAPCGEYVEMCLKDFDELREQRVFDEFLAPKEFDIEGGD